MSVCQAENLFHLYGFELTKTVLSRGYFQNSASFVVVFLFAELNWHIESQAN